MAVSMVVASSKFDVSVAAGRKFEPCFMFLPLLFDSHGSPGSLRSAKGQSTSFLSSPSLPSLQTITLLSPDILFIRHFHFLATFTFLDHSNFLAHIHFSSIQVCQVIEWFI